jgi:addiction module HigA family antidote
MRLIGMASTFMGNGMSLSRGAKTLVQAKSVSRGGKGKRENYILAPPVSPGDVLRDYIFSEPEITQERLAKAMLVSRFSVNQIVNGKRAVTADMALRLAHVTSTTPDLWLNLQRDVDLYTAERKLGQKIRSMKVLRSPKTERELFIDKD